MANRNGKYYVTATDKVWGDKIVAECTSRQKAYEIEEKWLNRSDLKYVNVRSTKPYYKSYVMYDENLNEIVSYKR